MENREEPVEQYTPQNPDPNSNHEWFAQFDPNSAEYHGGGGTKFFFKPNKPLPQTFPNPL